MSWFRRKDDPARPRPMIPERIDAPTITIKNITYKWKSLGDGQFYHWWTCPSCRTEVGACNYQGDLNHAVLSHLRECVNRRCDQESCINCKPSPVVIP